jgi:hypothetical protein
MSRPFNLFASAFICGTTFFLTVSTLAAEKPIDFNRDIRPIFSENCYACHGPDHNKRKNGLRFDHQEEPFQKLESGKIAIVPGDLANSEMIRRITTSDPDDHMPPPDSLNQLSKEQIELLKRWVKEGAKWKGHWAYIPPERPEVPKVKKKSWVRNAIDNFILARLEKEGLKPSREADKATLIRRVTFDLTGLPPTIEEVDAFLADKSANAYEKLVDRLLESPAFGERMAEGWLDLARYADTNGYHIDNHRDMWLWRQWVIDAFNKNMPFDEFTIEQLAGDMLPNATVDQKIASGFNRNNMVNFEGGADPDEYATKYVVDRVDTTATVWLGSTLRCAECHDHKFDPFSQKEFYQFYALFNNIPEKGLDGKTENPVPSIKVPSPSQKAQIAKLEKQIASSEKKLKAKLESPNPKLDAAQAKWEDALKENVFSGWTILEPTKMKSSAGATFTNLPDQSILVGGTNADKDSYELVFKTTNANIAGIRVEALADETTKKAGRYENGNFVLSSVEVEAKNPSPDKDQKLEAPTLGDWYVLGPFKYGTISQAFARAGINEKSPKVDLAKTYESESLRWTRKPDWKDGEVRTLEGGDYYGYYLHRTISVKNGRPMMLSLGSDDGIQVWLNGKKVLSNKATRAAAPDQEKLMLWLESGENNLLIKINNGIGGIAYYFKAEENLPEKFTVPFGSAIADYSQKGFDVKGALDNDKETGWGILDAAENEHQAIFISKQAFGYPGGTTLKLKLNFDSKFKQHSMARFRVAISSSETLTETGELPSSVQTILFKAPEKRSAAQRAALKKEFRETNVPEIQDLNKTLASRKEELTKIQAAVPSTMVMEEMEKPRDTFVLVRGSFQHKGEKVTAAVPKVLFHGKPEDMPTNRLQLARWLVSTNHPLTARVTVNRFWQMLFGTGLVKSANDFGSQGNYPTHPELLDWLATEFMNPVESSNRKTVKSDQNAQPNSTVQRFNESRSWDMKHILKLMVMSATYRQSSEITPQMLERDSANRLLARGPRFRMDAEMIHDNALAVSGLLTRKIGGESVRPYQPPGLWEAIGFGAGFTSQSYTQSKGDDLYRRAVYIYLKRSLPYPSLNTFDAPSREVCTVKRPRTTTPLQALVLMHDPVYIEAARALGQRILQEGKGDIDDRIKFAFRLTLSRAPEKGEMRLLEKIYREQLEHFKNDPKAAKELISVGESTRPENLDASELAAWTAIGNILLNLDETITKG